MRALIVDPTRPHAMRLANVPQPLPKHGQVLVEVRHIALNPFEIHLATSGRLPPHWVLGWDTAGIVVAAAHDPGESGRVWGEYGPSIGDRVVAHGRRGGWAQRRTATVDNLAVVPDAVDLAAAATLPVAAGTALGALREAGALLGKRVLVTGASGGVGRFAVQLAALAGAFVVASVGCEARSRGLRELGAGEIVVGLDEVTEPVHVVLDAVGGHQLVQAFGLLAPGGVIQSFGGSSGEPAVFPPYSTAGPGKSLRSFELSPALADDLIFLLGLVEEGSLTAEIGWRGPWERHEEAVNALLTRRVNGKAVLDIT
ncbi:MAG: zinc-binding dehydrogenase [Dactylosporangium sp.]|nr:zinc-binding dehydrogenase [Dactylosporangium sp.]NNJ63547.1 zinc-binding dehydrogenase [Dactylosporangium sp.]